MILKQPPFMQHVLDGCFIDFDISNTKQSILSTDLHSLTIYEYDTKIKHQIDIKGIKNARYYPYGNKLVTGSNNEGLFVYDIYSIKLLHHYNDEVYNHSYTNRNTIFASTFGGIKMYDLRCRANVGYLPIGNSKGFDVYKDSFCVFTDSKIMKGNMKRMTIDSVIHVENTKSVKHFDSDIFFYVCEKDGYSLCTNKHDYIKKVENYRMSRIDKFVGLYGKNDLMYLTLDKMYCQQLDCTINNVIYKQNENRAYILTDKGISRFSPEFVYQEFESIN